MSKSKKNVVEPSLIIDTYGADTARWFMLSDSPPERDLDWTDAGILGVHGGLREPAVANGGGGRAPVAVRPARTRRRRSARRR